MELRGNKSREEKVMDRLDKAIEFAENKLKNCDKPCGYGFNLEYMDNLKKELKALKFYNNLFPNKDIRIQLKNIDISDKTLINQIEKVIKDGNKFAKSVVTYVLVPIYEKDIVVCKEDAIKTFWEMVQTGLGVLQKIDVDADEVMSEYPKFLDKLKK